MRVKDRKTTYPVTSVWYYPYDLRTLCNSTPLNEFIYIIHSFENVLKEVNAQKVFSMENLNKWYR